MANYKVVTDQDIGNGLKVENGKLTVKIDDQTLVLNDEGVLQAVVTADFKLVRGEVNSQTGTVVMIVSDGTTEREVELPLSAFTTVSEETNNLVVKKDDGVYVGKTDVQTAAKEAADVTLQSLGGVNLANAFPAA